MAFDCAAFSAATGAGVVAGAGGFAPGKGDGLGTGVWVGGGVELCAAAGADNTVINSSVRVPCETTSIL